MSFLLFFCFTAIKVKEKVYGTMKNKIGMELTEFGKDI